MIPWRLVVDWFADLSSTNCWCRIAHLTHSGEACRRRDSTARPPDSSRETRRLRLTQNRVDSVSVRAAPPFAKKAGGYRTLDQLAALQVDPATRLSSRLTLRVLAALLFRIFPAVNRSASALSVVAVAESASSCVLLCSRTGKLSLCSLLTARITFAASHVPGSVKQSTRSLMRIRYTGMALAHAHAKCAPIDRATSR